jgi:hypothetical protein
LKGEATQGREAIQRRIEKGKQPKEGRQSRGSNSRREAIQRRIEGESTQRKGENWRYSTPDE